MRDTLRAALEQAGQCNTAEARKPVAGRKPLDESPMFKMLVLQSLWNLGDDAVDYLVSDRLSFMRFPGLGLQDGVPDAKTVWLYREALATSGVIEELFADFGKHLKDKGYLAMGGQVADATIVATPANHNKETENAAIKADEVPAGWAENPPKRARTDRDARWTQKHGNSYYGYKNHVRIDSQEFDAVLNTANTSR